MSVYIMSWGLFQTSKIDSPQLEATFDTVIEVFSFLDKNGDGKLNKTDMVKALNEAYPLEKSPAHVTRTRFSINSFATMVKLVFFLSSIWF